MLPKPPEPQESADDSIFLETLEDILGNGGRIPTDSILLQRLTLAGVREVYRSSSRNQNQLRRQWAAILAMFAAIGSLAAVTTVTHNQIWEAVHALQEIIGR